MSLRGAYRASGADLPWGDPLPAHTGVRMEGYFWRLTDPATGRVVIALCGVNRARDGFWSTLGLASHPNGFLRTLAHPEGWADPAALGARAGDAFVGAADRLTVDLGEDARLDVRVTDAVPWPRRALGGSSVFQAVPALNQYWHPWLLGGRAHGSAVVGDERWELDGWQVYAEKTGAPAVSRKPGGGGRRRVRRFRPPQTPPASHSPAARSTPARCGLR